MRRTSASGSIADDLALEPAERAVAYYVGLLACLGCHADSHEQGAWFGDGIAVRADPDTSVQPARRDRVRDRSAAESELPAGHEPVLARASSALSRDRTCARMSCRTSVSAVMDAIDAVLGGAGHRLRRRREGPAGLTHREVEVLVLLTPAISGEQRTRRRRLHARRGGPGCGSRVLSGWPALRSRDPPIRRVHDQFIEKGGRPFVCPICFRERDLDDGELVPNAELKGATPLMEFAGDGAMTFSY